jgi:hypothetical protein
METITLRAAFPCCYRVARLRAIVAVPIETYRRRCAPCETSWSIRRETIATGKVRLDRLEWLDTRSHDYVRMYGS